jgi:hypothetical protein
MPPLPRQVRAPRRAARPTSSARPRVMRHGATPVTEERPPRAGPASDKGPRRPGHPAVTRLASRVRRWARLRRRHAVLVRRPMKTAREETRARHRVVWACTSRTSAMPRRWRMSAQASPSRRAAHDFVRWSAAVQQPALARSAAPSTESEPAIQCHACGLHGACRDELG